MRYFYQEYQIIVNLRLSCDRIFDTNHWHLLGKNYLRYAICIHRILSKCLTRKHCMWACACASFNNIPWNHKKTEYFFVGSWKLHVSFVGKRYILSSVLDLNIRTGGAFAHIMHDILRGTSPLIYSRKRANILTNVKLPYRVCTMY